jgi:hypothetical protein
MADKTEEREICQLGHGEMELLYQMLKDGGVFTEKRCFYCNELIADDKPFSIYNKPDRIICNSILCLAEAVADYERMQDGV